MTVNSDVIHVDLTNLQLLATVFIPLLVGIVTKARASRLFKSVTHAVLAAAGGLVATAMNNGGNVPTKAAVSNIIAAFVISTAVHYKVWKPSGVTDKVVNATADIGVG